MSCASPAGVSPKVPYLILEIKVAAQSVFVLGRPKRKRPMGNSITIQIFRKVIGLEVNILEWPQF